MKTIIFRNKMLTLQKINHTARHKLSIATPIMKKTFVNSSALYKLLIIACFVIYTQSLWAINSTRTIDTLKNVPGFVLQPGKMYVVLNTMEINATDGGDGLQVAPKVVGKQAPILFIPENVKLTVNGGNATGDKTAGAGIKLPTNAELIITGAGRLACNGGKASRGGSAGIGGVGGSGIKTATGYGMGKLYLTGTLNVRVNAGYPTSCGIGAGSKSGVTTTADNGFIYVSPKVLINDTKGAAPSNYEGNKSLLTAPTDMQVTINLVNNELNKDGSKAENVKLGTITCNIGDPLPSIKTSTYLLPAIDQVDKSEKYFAGYYTSESGLGDRIFKGIADGDNLAPAVMAVPFSKNQTIYAHFVHTHHIINWDYTYSSGMDSTTHKSAWTNLNETEFLKYGKLILYGHMSPNGARNIIKEIIMEAYYTNNEYATSDSNDHNFMFFAKPKAGAENHTRAIGNLFLHATEGKDQLNTSENINIYLTDEQLAQFSDYEFIPWNYTNEHDKMGSKPANWETIVDRIAHQTVFSYTGAKNENMFTLKWKVTITGLKYYPDRIFIKPLYLDKDNEWQLISQLPLRYNGVTCPAATDLENPGKAGVTYIGEYPVWKQNSLTQEEYDNKIGLVGFSFNGHIYYMDDNNGDVSNEQMRSEDHTTFRNRHTLQMTIKGSTLPVKPSLK